MFLKAAAIQCFLFLLEVVNDTFGETEWDGTDVRARARIKQPNEIYTTSECIVCSDWHAEWPNYSGMTGNVTVDGQKLEFCKQHERNVIEYTCDDGSENGTAKESLCYTMTRLVPTNTSANSSVSKNGEHAIQKGCVPASEYEDAAYFCDDYDSIPKEAWPKKSTAVLPTELLTSTNKPTINASKSSLITVTARSNLTGAHVRLDEDLIQSNIKGYKITCCDWFQCNSPEHAPREWVPGVPPTIPNMGKLVMSSRPNIITKTKSTTTSKVEPRIVDKRKDSALLSPMKGKSVSVYGKRNSNLLFTAVLVLYHHMRVMT